MTDQENKPIAEALGKIELTLVQMLDAQRESSKSHNEWIAADIRLREELLRTQKSLIESNGITRQSYRRTLLLMGMLAGIMLLIGLGLITERWWLPMVQGAS